MNSAVTPRHTCHRCEPHDVQGPFRQQGHEDAPALESIDTTYSEQGDVIFYASGYSAREVAQKRALESGGRVYVNNISRNIKRRDLSNTLAPVFYAVAKSSVYTLRGQDAVHDKIYRAYWPAL
jgi:hypothetical protein